MFKTTDDLKSFIIWARTAQIAQLQVGDVQVVFAPQAFLDANTPDLTMPQATKPGNEEKDTGRLMVDDMQADLDDEALLFHSSRG